MDCTAHIVTFVVRVPDAEMVGLGFNPWVGHLGACVFSLGRSQRNYRCTLAETKENLGAPLPISLRWLECVDETLSARAVKAVSLARYSSLADEEEEQRLDKMMSGLQQRDEIAQKTESITKLQVAAFHCKTCNQFQVSPPPPPHHSPRENMMQCFRKMRVADYVLLPYSPSYGSPDYSASPSISFV